jgi:hypothetical protein
MKEVIEQVEVKSSGGRLWFGFPHYVVLGWALLLTYSVYELRDWRTSFEKNRSALIEQNSKNLETLTRAIVDLQEGQRLLNEDAVRTRTILELKFPVTARKVEDALTDEAGP